MASLIGAFATTEMPSDSASSSPLEGMGSTQGPPIALLDFFFPGFSMFSGAIQKYAGIDLNIYIPLLALLGGLIAAWQYFSEYFWRQIETYFMSTVDIRIDDEIYNMLMAWVAEQNFAKGARRFVANTNLNSRSWFLWKWDDDEEDDTPEDGDVSPISPIEPKKKSLAYTPTFGSHYFFYKGRLCIFRRDRGQSAGAGFLMPSEKEEISVSCFGRNPWVLKELLHDARMQFMKRDEAKTLIYRGTCKAGSTEPAWQRMMARVSRPFSTVILNEKVKQDLIDDVTDYLNPATRRWYANRGIPYRRGYLLYGPPGTGKSSLSLALAGFFKMRIYIVSLSSISSTEENLASLFAELPRRCVVLLEDIDTAGLTHTREEDRPQETTEEPTSPKLGLRGNDKGLNTGSNNNTGFRLSLSGLLNILDGVASQEGRVLIMTTNHLEKLDKALIRPGRVDMTVTFGLADSGMTAAIFRAIFAPLEADNPTGKANNNKPLVVEVDVERAAKRVADEKAQRDEAVAKVDKLSEVFAKKIPAHEFSPAELQGFLMKHKRSPEAAVEGAETWVVETRKEKVANKLKEAEEKRKKEAEEKKKKAEEEAKKKKEEEEEAEKKKKTEKEEAKAKKRKSKKSRKTSKKDKHDSSTESEGSSSDSGSGSESESEVESKKRKSKSKSKSKRKTDISIKVDKVPDEVVAKSEPVSAISPATDGFVDIEKDGSGEDARPKTRGSDSGYSTP